MKTLPGLSPRRCGVPCEDIRGIDRASGCNIFLPLREIGRIILKYGLMI
jgi:hypothetical protein